MGFQNKCSFHDIVPLATMRWVAKLGRWVAKLVAHLATAALGFEYRLLSKYKMGDVSKRVANWPTHLRPPIT
jgi:hypothetical protein